jgi:hypothetical protein
MWEGELIGTCHWQPQSIRHIFFWEDWSLILPRYWPALLCFPWKILFFLFYFYKKGVIFQSVESTWTINKLERVTVYLMHCTGKLKHKSVFINWEFLGKIIRILVCCWIYSTRHKTCAVNKFVPLLPTVAQWVGHKLVLFVWFTCKDFFFMHSRYQKYPSRTQNVQYSVRNSKEGCLYFFFIP